MQTPSLSRVRLMSGRKNSPSEKLDKTDLITRWLKDVHRHAGEWSQLSDEWPQLTGCANGWEHHGCSVPDRFPSFDRFDTILDAQTTDLNLLQKCQTSLSSDILELKHRIQQESRCSKTARVPTFSRQEPPETAKIYRKTCRRMKIHPMRRVYGQLGRSRIILNELCLTHTDVKATCKALIHEKSSTYLDLSGNSMNAVSCSFVLQMLALNHEFKQLRLADNNLSGAGVSAILKHFQAYHVITVLDLSGNHLTDHEGIVVAQIIQTSPQLKVLHAHHNEFREIAGAAIGKAIAETHFLEELDLSWNHLRQHGAVGIARGIQFNRSLEYINLAWNGLAFEGCVGLSDALRRNTTLEKLDISCNRIHPPALLELMKGLFCNKVLKILIMDRNPLTASFTSVFLEGIQKALPTMALQELSLLGVVVDRAFLPILEEIKQKRIFHVEYETSLPVSCRNRTEMLSEVQTKNDYNVEPLRMLYLLKEKNRAQDFFHKINKDHNDGLTPDELASLFKEAGIPVSKYVIDTIMDFMDTDRNGKIELGEFLVGDKKMKRLTRDLAKGGEVEPAYTRYSRTFRKPPIEELTSRLQVDETPPQYLSPLASITASPASSRRSSLNPQSL